MASAVLLDTSALSYDYRYEYKKIYQQDKQLELSDNISLEVFVKHGINDSENLKQYFYSIEESYINQDLGYITGRLSLQKLKKLHTSNSQNICCILLQVFVPEKTDYI